MAQRIREEVVKSGRDPRREESEPPPPDAAAQSADEKKSSVENRAESDKSPAGASPESAPLRPDPRLTELEKLIERGDWTALLARLKELGSAEKLPPNLGLLWALASKELESSEGPAVPEVNATAIRCAAALLGASEDSPIALVVAKRLLRKNPVSWRQTPAPPTRVSLLIVVVALVLGSGVGWLLANGYVVINLPGSPQPTRAMQAIAAPPSTAPPTAVVPMTPDAR